MNKVKRIISVILIVVTVFSVMSIAVNAASVSTTNTKYGYMMPTDAKGTKTVSSVKLYGDYDYINFYINSRYSDKYYFYEIYSDKNYTKVVDSGYFYCDEAGEYTASALVKLKGTFKSSTYYAVTYAASISSDGEARLSTSSLCEFKLTVKTSASFKEKIVVLNNMKTTVKGPQISWQGLSGATKYYIYRRPLTGAKWTKVGTVKSSVRSFTDTSVKNKNGKFVYTVKAVNKSGVSTRYHYAGLTCLFAKAPVLTSVATGADNKVKVQWKSTSSGAYYEVYRREVGQSSWTKLSTNCKTAYYNDERATNGKTYEYTVRANIKTAQGVARSSYYGNADKAVTFVQAPFINYVMESENGINISWNSVKGATAYTVYRKPFDGSKGWASLKKVSSSTTSFVDTTASDEGAYIYTVRAEGSKGRGSYNNNGRVYLKLEAPELKVVPNSGTDTVTLSWQKVPYAASYDVYKKDAEGQWVREYTDAYSPLTITPDTVGENEYSVVAKYVYKDILYNMDYVIVSDVDEGSIPFEFYPSVADGYMTCTSEEVEFGGLSCSWAEGVNIYRKLAAENDSELQLIAALTNESVFKDTEIEQGQSYTYVIKYVYKGEELPVESNRETVTIPELVNDAPASNV